MSGEGFIADQDGYYITKQAGSILDYSIDWSKWLEGDSIISSDWTLPAGLSQSDDAHDATSTSVKIAGGAAGSTYLVKNAIETQGGLKDSRSFRLIVEP